MSTIYGHSYKEDSLNDICVYIYIMSIYKGMYKFMFPMWELSQCEVTYKKQRIQITVKKSFKP